MYSFFRHRKLLNDSDEDPIFKFCKTYCNPIDNQGGSCPIQCLAPCYPICNHSVLIYEYSPPPPPPPPILISYDDDNQNRSHKLSVFFTFSLAVLAATFLIFAIYTAYKFYKGRYLPWRNRSSSPPPPETQQQDEVPIVREYFLDQEIGSMVDHPIWYIRTVGLQPSIISSIATCKYKRGDGLVEETDCSVCLSEFQEDEILRLLPKCHHAFHISCIDTWLRSHTNCPLCRALIVIATSNSQSTLSNIVESQMVENRVSDTDVETENPQLSINVDDDNESRVENDLRQSGEDVRSSVSQEWEENGGGGGEIQLIRRSVSMDSLAASAISAAIDRNLDKHLDQMTTGSSAPKGVDSSQKVLNSVCSSSNETSLLKGPSIMVKRSLSCSAKVFLSRYSKGRNSAPPPTPPPTPLP